MRAADVPVLIVGGGGAGLTASMLRDLESGGLVEADHIVGDLLTRARRRGVAAPLLTLAYTHLKAYELRRAATLSAKADAVPAHS